MDEKLMDLIGKARAEMGFSAADVIGPKFNNEMLRAISASTAVEAIERDRLWAASSQLVPQNVFGEHAKVFATTSLPSLALMPDEMYKAISADVAIEALERERMLSLAFPPVPDSVFGTRVNDLVATGLYSSALASDLASMKYSQSIASMVESSYAATISSEYARMAFNASSHNWLNSPEIEALRISLEPEAGIREILRKESERQKAFEGAFRRPFYDEQASLAAVAAVSSQLAVKVFGGSVETLNTMMVRMDSPWLRSADAGISVSAFADIQAMGRLLASANPFDLSVADAIRANLGDWRADEDFSVERYCDPVFRSSEYVNHGFDAALTDFPVPAFEQSVKIAGLDISNLYPEDDSEVDLEANYRVYGCLLKFEIRIRLFISTVMLAAFGEQWMKRQLPSGMLEKWMEKKAIARKAGAADFPLIDYADFSDYKAIIDRKDNWDKVFKPVFGRQEDIRESFQRLFPIRIATMHSRIITLEDELLLAIEARRILGAIRRCHGNTLIS